MTSDTMMGHSYNSIVEAQHRAAVNHVAAEIISTRPFTVYKTK